ncbi:MAG: alpha/beta hydrolase family protein [Kiritimatiellia bacterium]
MAYTYKSVYLDDEMIRGRVFDFMRPASANQKVSVFWVHGGGWVAGHREGGHAVIKALLQRGFVCATTDYRLTGVKALDQLADIREAYAAFCGLLAEHGLPERVCVYGESAGAHLAALLALAAPGACGESAPSDQPQGQMSCLAPVGAVLQSTPVCFTPWPDIFPRIWAGMQQIAGARYEDNPELFRRLSPIEYVDEKTCPVFFMEAENEHMFPHAQVEEFAGEMRCHGRRVELKKYLRVEHGFFYDLTRWQQRAALDDMVNFMLTL